MWAIVVPLQPTAQEPRGSHGSAGIRHAVSSFTYKVLSSPVEKACRLLVVMVAAPVLGVAAFGRFQYASTVTAMLAAMTSFGLGTWATRAIARNPSGARGVTSLGLRLRMLAMAPYVVLLGAVALIESAGDSRNVLLMFGVAALANAFVDYFGSVLRGHEDFRREATMNATRALLTTAGALGGLYLARSVLGLATGVMLGAIGSAVCALWLLRDRYRGEGSAGSTKETPSPNAAQAALREALPLWLTGLLATLYFRSDIVIVRYLAGEAEVGSYAAAYRIFEATTLLPAAIMAIAFPRLVRAAASDDRKASLERLLTLLLLTLGVVIAVGLSLAEGGIVRTLLGATFDRSQGSLRVLAYTVPVMFVSYAISDFVLARGRERSLVKVLGAMLVLNVSLNLAIVPRMGGVGAAWSTLITELAFVAACFALLASPTVARPQPESP